MSALRLRQPMNHWNVLKPEICATCFHSLCYTRVAGLVRHTSGRGEMLRKYFKPLSIGGFLVFLTACNPVTQSPPPPIVIAVSVTPSAAAINLGQSIQFTALTADPIGVNWSVNGATAGSSSSGTIDATGKYTAPSGTKSMMVTIKATSNSDPTKMATATLNVVPSGQVTATNNVQVAQYTISLPPSAKVFVQFGTDTNYGLTTWTQPAPQNGGPVSLFVAGMRAATLYHMRGVVQFSDGTQLMDTDQTFMTGNPPAAQLPMLTSTTTPGMTPQGGVELLSLLDTHRSSKFGAVVADLSGNVLWTYDPGLAAGLIANPIKLMPNGHFLINFSNGSIAGNNSVLQEVDLAGNLIWQMTAADLNNALAAATCAGCNITVVGTHHDFAILPNGHIIALAATHQIVTFVDLIRDVLIDLDHNTKPH